MSTSSYQQIVQQFGQLTVDEQQQLVHELTRTVASRTPDEPRRSLLELQGLGKEVWEGVDATDFVRAERSTWRG